MQTSQLQLDRSLSESHSRRLFPLQHHNRPYVLPSPSLVGGKNWSNKAVFHRNRMFLWIPVMDSSMEGNSGHRIVWEKRPLVAEKSSFLKSFCRLPLSQSGLLAAPETGVTPNSSRSEKKQSDQTASVADRVYSSSR